MKNYHHLCFLIALWQQLVCRVALGATTKIQSSPVLEICQQDATTTTTYDDDDDDDFPPVPLINLKSWTTKATTTDATKLTQEQLQVVQQIRSACETVGFFTIQNHALDSSVSWNTWMVTQQFFGLPLEEKLLYKTHNEQKYPYGFEQSEQLAKGKLVDSENNNNNNDNNNNEMTLDLKETFSMGPNDLASGMPLRQWPQDDNNSQFQKEFGSALDSYYQDMEDLANRLLQIMALALEQPIDYFENKMDHHMSALRLVNYYPLKDFQDYNGTVIRAGAHTDYGALTILNAQTAGLQVLRRKRKKSQEEEKDDTVETQWYSVPITPGTLIINLGDLMQRWTNDKWVSTMHRVVMPATQALERRYSMAFFVNINGDAVVEPLDSCLTENDENSKKKYPPISAKEHLMAKHLASMGEEDKQEEQKEEDGSSMSSSSPDPDREEL